MDFIFFQTIHQHFDSLLKVMADGSFLRLLTLLQTILEPVVVLWVTWQGYMMATGQSQTRINDFIFDLAKVAGVVILTHQLIHHNQAFRQGAEDFTNSLVAYLTGQAKVSMYAQIDAGLLTMQNTINALNNGIPLEQLGLNQMSSSAWMSAIGQGLPLLVLGALMFMCKFALMLAIILAPIFVFSLLFRYTHNFFWTWLRYAIGIVLIWSVVVLVGVIVLRLLGAYAHSILDIIHAEPNSSKPNASLLNSALLQCLLGLLLTLLLISVPKIIFGLFNAAFAPAFNRLVQSIQPIHVNSTHTPLVATSHNTSVPSNANTTLVPPLLTHNNRVTHQTQQLKQNTTHVVPHQVLSQGRRAHATLNRTQRPVQLSLPPVANKEPKTLEIDFNLNQDAQKPPST